MMVTTPSTVNICLTASHVFLKAEREDVLRFKTVVFLAMASAGM